MERECKRREKKLRKQLERQAKRNLASKLKCQSAAGDLLALERPSTGARSCDSSSLGCDSSGKGDVIDIGAKGGKLVSAGSMTTAGATAAPAATATTPATTRATAPSTCTTTPSLGKKRLMAHKRSLRDAAARQQQQQQQQRAGFSYDNNNRWRLSPTKQDIDHHVSSDTCSSSGALSDPDQLELHHHLPPGASESELEPESAACQARPFELDSRSGIRRGLQERNYEQHISAAQLYAKAIERQANLACSSKSAAYGAVAQPDNNCYPVSLPGQFGNHTQAAASQLFSNQAAMFSATISQQQAAAGALPKSLESLFSRQLVGPIAQSQPPPQQQQQQQPQQPQAAPFNNGAEPGPAIDPNSHYQQAMLLQHHLFLNQLAMGVFLFQPKQAFNGNNR